MLDRYNRGDKFGPPRPILTVITGRDHDTALGFYGAHYSNPHAHEILWTGASNVRDHMDELESVFRTQPSAHAVMVLEDDCWINIEPYVAYHPDWQIEWLAFEWLDRADWLRPNMRDHDRYYNSVFVNVITRRKKPR